MLTARLDARPAQLAAALALVPVLLVGSASSATAVPAPVVSSPLPVGEVSGSPSPEPTPTSTPTEIDDEPVAETSASADPLTRLVQLAVGAGLLLGVAGGVGLYLTRKSRGAHR